jgi:hypothetical protein
MVEAVDEWAVPLLNDPAKLQTRGYQSYAVLTLCRMLNTLQTGSVATKPVAARWALATLDARWAPLIERAWEGRHNPAVEPIPEDVNETLEFVRYTVERSREV